MMPPSLDLCLPVASSLNEIVRTKGDTEGYITSATSSIRLQASLKLGTVSSSVLVWEIGALR